MDISFFRRGIKLSRRARPGKIEQIPPPGRAVLSLQQGSGPPAEPSIEIGETVKVGQTLAQCASGSGADLHASISGEVTAFEDLHFPNGTTVKALVIEGDGKDTWAEPERDDKPLTASPGELLERIRRGGVIREGSETKSLAEVIGEAMSPRGYLSSTGSAVAKPVRHIAVRFADQDPHLDALAAMTETIGDKTADLDLGVKVLASITGAEQIHFVLDNKQKTPGLDKLADDNDYAVLRLDATNYPDLSSPMVARAVSGKEPDTAFKRVHENGILVLDVDTVLETALAARDRRPVVNKLITVNGPAGAGVFEARLGTPLADIVSAAGQKKEIGKVVLGGPMKGIAHHNLEFPLTKEISGITLFSRDQIDLAVNDPCVGCGLCSMVCPIRLTPGMLSRYCEFSSWDLAEEAHLFSCIECGCCAYVCPAGRSMVQFMVQGKSELLSTRRSES